MSKTALITGASGGIGYELAWLFGRDGFDCILVARSHDKLSALAARLESEFRVKTLVLPKDLSKPAAVDEIYEEVGAASMEVDVLVNNAGFPVFGLFTETNLETELEMLQVNITALTTLTKLFLKGMTERRYGRILNLASTAAFEPGPLMAVYYASKAYVLSFSEALANELRGSGVTVTALAPGPTRTGFQKRAGLEREVSDERGRDEIRLDEALVELLDDALDVVSHGTQSYSETPRDRIVVEPLTQ